MNTENPKISVVMSVYNGEKYLKEAVDSILNQSFKDFEFIIINDGSTDGSKEILENYKDERIRLFNNQNQGLIGSLNEAIGYSRGEYIARMDADDISLPERLEKQISFMESKKIVLCGSWAEVIDSIGNTIKHYIYPPIGSKKIRLYSIIHCPFIHPSVMFRKEIFEKVGGYKSYKNIEDYELWTRIIYKNDTDNIPEELIKYRIHDNQITKKNKSEMRVKGFFVRSLALWRFVFRF